MHDSLEMSLPPNRPCETISQLSDFLVLYHTLCHVAHRPLMVVHLCVSRTVKRGGVVVRLTGGIISLSLGQAKVKDGSMELVLLSNSLAGQTPCHSLQGEGEGEV